MVSLDATNTKIDRSSSENPQVNSDCTIKYFSAFDEKSHYLSTKVVDINSELTNPSDSFSNLPKIKAVNRDRLVDTVGSQKNDTLWYRETQHPGEADLSRLYFDDKGQKTSIKVKMDAAGPFSKYEALHKDKNSFARFLLQTIKKHKEAFSPPRGFESVLYSGYMGRTGQDHPLHLVLTKLASNANSSTPSGVIAGHSFVTCDQIDALKHFNLIIDDETLNILELLDPEKGLLTEGQIDLVGGSISRKIARRLLGSKEDRQINPNKYHGSSHLVVIGDRIDVSHSFLVRSEAEVISKTLRKHPSESIDLIYPHAPDMNDKQVKGYLEKVKSLFDSDVRDRINVIEDVNLTAAIGTDDR